VDGLSARQVRVEVRRFTEDNRLELTAPHGILGFICWLHE
jgi:hypothetical protein